MTVVAWDGRMIASDRQATVGEVTLSSCKLSLFPQHGIAAACGGSAGRSREFLAWIEHGREPAAFPDWQRDEDQAVHCLLIDNGLPYIYSLGCIPIKIENRYYAIGTGAELAIGAMHAGANAIEAVEIANLVSPSCGMGLDWAVCVPEESGLWGISSIKWKESQR